MKIRKYKKNNNNNKKKNKKGKDRVINHSIRTVLVNSQYEQPF